tara:strand:+ start:2127 stop:2384 length:258 start_codon:yes stop_codon:yes gene_type:complete
MEKKLEELKKQLSEAKPGSLKAKLLQGKINLLKKRMDKEANPEKKTKVGKFLKNIKDKAENVKEDVSDAITVIKIKKLERDNKKD